MARCLGTVLRKFTHVFSNPDLKPLLENPPYPL